MIDLCIKYQGFVYRGHNPKWSYNPTSGEGAARHGGRFNLKGVNALYTSESFETAWAEAQQAFPFKTQPLTICTYEVDSNLILDLTDLDVLAAIGYQLSDLSCAWESQLLEKKEPPSHRIAKELISHGISGIKAPSYALGAPAGAKNIVFWNWQNVLPNKVVVVDDNNRLPKNQKSW